MKYQVNYQHFIIPACLAVIILLYACSSVSQITATPEEITRAVNNDRWKFSAQHVSPSYGRSRNLTNEYFVTTTSNKLVVALPYFGKLNSPAGSLDGNPLDFESTKFNSTKESWKDGGWLVTIKNPDPEVQSMVFTFFDNGTAQLNIIMTNRTGISYSGKVAPIQ
jgi:hypothetical protein